jgi:hypothetical protein
MHLIVIGPVGHKEERYIDNRGLSLGALLQGKDADVRVNGALIDDWSSFVPHNGDEVEVTLGAGWFAPAAFVPLFGAYAGVAAAVVNTIISLTVSLALSMAIKALTPKPKKPKLNSSEQAFGIAGLSNTKGRGTPAFVPYGQNRIFGHVISSGAIVSPDGKQMWGKILYFMGDTGGDAIQSISDIRIDGTSIEQYPDMGVHIRTGTSVQPVIPEFENQDSLFQPTVSALPFDSLTQTGTPVIYTTHGNDINRATLFFAFPGGLYRIGDTGTHRFAGVDHLIEIRPNSGGAWTEVATLYWFEKIESGLFKTYELNFPSAGKWDIRVTVVHWVNYHAGEAFSGDSLLFNVQETKFTTKTYPGWALLGITNIPSKQVQSLENMNCSALVEGKRVKVWNGSAHTLMYTRQRCWIVRDMMTNPFVGMGSEIAEAEIDDDQWLESQGYYDDMVTGHDGLEVRDLCDVVINDSDWDWEWVKKVAGEGRGRIIPSGSKWKYVIDKPSTPNLLYTEGGNIIDGSIGLEISPPDRPFTQVSGEFRDADKDYEHNFSPPITDSEAVSTVPELISYDTITRESQVQRENFIVFKRNFLERRRWSFSSPMGAIVSEPMDLDYFAERGIGNKGAYGGILPGGETGWIITLPDVVVLESGSTYALIVKHQRDNTTEYRTVNTAAGTWGQVSVTVPFVTVPVEGDIFSLGIQDVEHIITRAQDLEIDRNGNIRQTRTEYVPAVYDESPLPPKSGRRFFGPLNNRPPIPLRYVTVSEQISLNKDGSTRSVLAFTVTPGLPQHAGIASGGAPNAIGLSAEEPALDNYFNGAKVTTGSDRLTITSYDGPGRGAFVLPYTFTTTPVAGDQYIITWERFGEFGGFVIEVSEDGANYSPFATVNGTSIATDSQGVGPGVVYFRFTPFSTNGVQNTLARHLVGITITGDVSAPAAPVSVVISSHLKDVRVLVTLQKPVAEDFSGVEVELWRNALVSGTLLEVARFGAPGDTGESGTMAVDCSFNLGARLPPESYGTVIWARARSVDYSNNLSAFVNSTSGTQLAGDPDATGVIGPPAIPTGLRLSTGTQVDPGDGVIKAFLDITWNANTEIDISHYEVHFRLVGGLPITSRIVYHPQISIREIGVIAATAYEARIQAINRANMRSGFTSPWTLLPGDGLTARDLVPPGIPGVTSIMGGFKQVSIFLTPPTDADFEAIDVIISPFNDLAGPATGFAGSTASDSIQFIATQYAGAPLANGTTYYFWFRSRDRSGNVSAVIPGPFNGIPATTIPIGSGDVIQTSALITQFAQIQQGLIQDAHISDLSANKITAGTLDVNVSIGVGQRLFLLGNAAAGQAAIVVLDDFSINRVQLGKLGPSAQDYGLQIFGPDGSIWHSLTGGTQTAGRQHVNTVTHAISIPSVGEFHLPYINVWWAGVFPIQNTTTTITVRVTAIATYDTQAKVPVRVTELTFVDYGITHNMGKVPIATVGLVNAINANPSTLTEASATIQVDFW